MIQWIGIIMMAMLFGGLFVGSLYIIGTIGTLCAFGTTAFLIIWIGVASHLISGDDKDTP